jgi:hypothetical protein
MYSYTIFNNIQEYVYNKMLRQLWDLEILPDCITLV